MTHIYILLVHLYTINLSIKEPYIFEIIDTPRGTFVKTCIDENLYIDNLALPYKNGYKTGTKYKLENPIFLIDCYWEGDCLCFPYYNESKSELIEKIDFMTNIDINQIQIINIE